MTVLRSGSASDVGRVRTLNEDRALESLSLYAVADGMGGHAGGEVAARTAIDALQDSFAHHPTADGLRAAVERANEAVWERSLSDPDLRGMGTTLIAAALVANPAGAGDLLVVSNVGDSRAYRFNGTELVQLTTDHSVAEELVARGEITSAEAEIHPHRHILTRALGVSPEVQADTWEIVPAQGERFLLCSDGLTNEVSTEQIARVLGSASDPQEAADTLVRMANEHGGSDNVTVVVLDVLVGDAPQGAPLSPDVFVAATGQPQPGNPPQPGNQPQPYTGLQAAGSVAAVDAVHTGHHAHMPSRFTLRVALFVVVLGGLTAGAWAVTRWYVDDSYYVGLRQGQLVIFEGRPGGFMWFKPRPVLRTGVDTSEVLAYRIPALDQGVQEPSLAAARQYVHNLRAEAIATRGSSTSTGSPSSSSYGPAGPPSTTSTTSLSPTKSSSGTSSAANTAGAG